jgi:hypothetical protein
MSNYNLPKVPNNHRWYLARHSNRYACLKLQKETWRGWLDIESEMVCLVGYPLPFEVALKQAADDIVRILEAPEIEYGVIR